MDDQAVRALASEEKTYWWHISRRLILKTVLGRFCSIVRHPVCPSVASERRKELSLRHPGPTGQRPSSDSGSRPGFRVPPGMTKEKQPGMTMMKILDVGCGTGENFKWLRQFGAVTGVDTNELAVDLANQQGQAVLGRAEDLPFEEREFGLITAFDVLEHLSDEARALREWGRVLRSGGHLFLSVPAYQWLFGSHDRALEHYRRYNRSGLIKLLKDNGFQPIFSSYIFCLTFPLFLLQRLVASITKKAPGYTPVPKLINSFLVSLGEMEASWLKFSKFPFGSSIIIVARKND